VLTSAARLGDILLSAIDYLRRLQSECEFDPELSDRLISHRRQAGGALKNYGGAKISIEGREQFLREFIVEPFLSCLPAEDRRSLEKISVGLLPTYEPNAWAISFG
jgi:hypothetical protein